MSTSLQHGSNVLGPASISTLNRLSDNAQAPKRRRPENGQEFCAFSLPFTATSLSKSSFQPFFTFTPVAQLSRAQLPLAWLDSSHEIHLVPSGFLFQAKIPFAENEAPQDQTPALLVVRLPADGGLYAIEALGDESYIAFRLAGWVTERHVVGGGQTQGRQQNQELHQLLAAQSDPDLKDPTSVRGCRTTQPDLTIRSSPRKPKNRRGILARMSILPAKDAPGKVVTVPAPAVNKFTEVRNPICEEYARPISNTASLGPTSENSNPPARANVLDGHAGPSNPKDSSSLKVAIPDLQDAIDDLQQQYLETLYTSQTSLAYFAKGPLTRARTRTQLSETTKENILSLVEFYCESIIPTKKMDLKYKETIPKMIRELPSVQARGANDESSLEPVASRGNGKKKKKLGKNGMYPAEGKFLARWWYARVLSEQFAPTSETQSRETKKLVAQLRNRETEMQILLILEAVALELPSLAKPMEKSLNDLIKEEPSEQSEKDCLSRTPVTKRKKRDLGSDLDILLDRLCIWHTIGVDDILACVEKKIENDTNPAMDVKDSLRGFCTDVVIPFYASRLPEQCQKICRKLGGPDMSRKRVKSVRAKPSCELHLPPGLATKTQQRPISKQTLKTVLGEDNTFRNSSPPNLSRSSTAPLVPGLKREPTEPLRRPGSRGGIQKSRSFVDREIDLVADAKAQESKRRRLENLAEQKRQLEVAIEALRKPNRQLAGKVIMEEFESRSNDKDVGKGGTLGRRISGSGIQVTATPKKRKLADESQPGSCLPPMPALAFPGKSINDDAVPSSAVRSPPAAQGFLDSRSLTRRRGVLVGVEETPSHGLSKKSNPLGLSMNCLRAPSPTQQLCTNPQEPSASTSQLCDIQETQSDHGRQPDVVVTSITPGPFQMIGSRRPTSSTTLEYKESRLRNPLQDTPEAMERAGKAMDRVMGGGVEETIYESLGWNDEIDELT